MRIVLVRHGETSYNRDGLVQGQNDLGLTSQSRRQVATLGRVLEEYTFEALHTSSLRWAFETAEIIARGVGLPIKTIEDLKKVNVGHLDRLTTQELGQRHPEFLDRWRNDVGSAVIPGGEALRELQARVWSSLESIVAQHPEGTVLAVTHNFAISMILCQSLGLPISSFCRLRHQTASRTTLEYDRGEWVLVGLNDLCHMAPSQSAAPRIN